MNSAPEPVAEFNSRLSLIQNNVIIYVYKDFGHLTKSLKEESKKVNSLFIFNIKRNSIVLIWLFFKNIKLFKKKNIRGSRAACSLKFQDAAC